MHTKAVRVVLVAGALASVATSQAPERWSESKEQPITFQMAPSEASKSYAIFSELSTPAYRGLDGLVQVHVTFAGNPSPTELLTITLRSLTDPNLPPDVFGNLAVGPSSDLYLDLPAWTTCTSDPCDSAFELVFEHDASAMGGLPYTISATIFVDVSGEGWPTPEGTELTLDVVAQ